MSVRGGAPGPRVADNIQLAVPYPGDTWPGQTVGFAFPFNYNYTGAFSCGRDTAPTFQVLKQVQAACPQMVKVRSPARDHACTLASACPSHCAKDNRTAADGRQAPWCGGIACGGGGGGGGGCGSVVCVCRSVVWWWWTGGDGWVGHPSLTFQHTNITSCLQNRR